MKGKKVKMLNLIKEKGITLIGLVITIIVILILAGVSIMTLTGKNGFLTKVEESKKRNDIAHTEELIKLASDSALIDGEGEIIYSNLVKELDKEFGKDKYSIVPKDSNVTSWTVTISTSAGTAEVKINGVATEEQIDGIGEADEALKNDFGKLVEGYTGYTATDASNWRLFYADDKNAYLISDSIGRKILTLSNEKISNVGKVLNQKYTDNSSWQLKSDGTNINENIKAVTWLTDTSSTGEWVKYKTDFTNWAMGAPTVELFVASYNATHDSSKQIDFNVSTNAIGYELGWKKLDGTATDFKSIVDDIGNSDPIDKAIYANEDDDYWWIASTSCFDEDCLIGVYTSWEGFLDAYPLSSPGGIRPIVAIPKNKITDGTIKITDYYFND